MTNPHCARCLTRRAVAIFTADGPGGHRSAAACDRHYQILHDWAARTGGHVHIRHLARDPPDNTDQTNQLELFDETRKENARGPDSHDQAELLGGREDLGTES